MLKLKTADNFVCINNENPVADRLGEIPIPGSIKLRVSLHEYAHTLAVNDRLRHLIRPVVDDHDL